MASCNLRIPQLNVRSIVPKFNQLRDFVQNGSFDIVGISETWLTVGISDNVIANNRYDIFRKGRMGGQGGGVLIYVRSDFACRVVDIVSEYSEQVWVRVRLRNIKITFGVVYRPSNYNIINFSDEFEQIISHQLTLSDSLILTCWTYKRLTLSVSCLFLNRTISNSSWMNLLDLVQVSLPF